MEVWCASWISLASTNATLKRILAALLIITCTSLVSCRHQLSWEALQTEVHLGYPDVVEVAPEELIQWMNDPTPPLLLDVRAVEEYRVSHLSGAAHREQFDDLGVPRTRRIVVYCSVGYRSADAARQLQDLGYTNVYNLAGSIFRWANEGRPLVAGGKPTREVHSYDPVWGRYLGAGSQDE